MEPDTIAIMVFTGFVASGLGALLWTRLNRIEDRLDRLEREVGGCVRRDEFVLAVAELRGEIAELRGEIAELRGEITDVRTGLGREIASLRSDLTQIALAVGAQRPRASEG